MNEVQLIYIVNKTTGKRIATAGYQYRRDIKILGINLTQAEADVMTAENKKWYKMSDIYLPFDFDTMDIRWSAETSNLWDYENGIKNWQDYCEDEYYESLKALPESVFIYYIVIDNEKLPMMMFRKYDEKGEMVPCRVIFTNKIPMNKTILRDGDILFNNTNTGTWATATRVAGGFRTVKFDEFISD